MQNFSTIFSAAATDFAKTYPRDGALYQQAELGKRYQKELEDSIVRLGLSLELGVEAPVLRSIAKTAAAEDLIRLKSALEERLAESMPAVTQLGSCRGKEEKVESGFLI